MASRPRLLVVGGGYVGCDVARRLDGVMDVTLVEPKPAFLHSPALIRALVLPGLLEVASIPYNNLLPRGRIIRSRVAALHPEGATLTDCTEVKADFTLVATGSSYALPFKSSSEDINAFLSAHRTLSDRIAEAKYIAIIGAGPVGTEMAGEIAAARPGVTVTLIAAAARLMPHHPAALGQALRGRLERLGVDVVTNQTVLNLSPDNGALTGPLALADGREIPADLVLPALGALPNTDLLQDLPGMRLNSTGRVETDPWLRPAPNALPGLFIGGDMAATGDAMTIVATMRQSPYLAKIIRSIAKGKNLETLEPYKPWRDAPMLVPTGPRFGASHLPLPGPLAQVGTIRVLGDTLTRLMKGTDLFVPKYRKALGAPQVKASSG